MLDDMETRLRDILGDMIYGIDEETIAGAVVKQFLVLDLKLAMVETNTGGSVARRLTGVSDGLSVLKQSLTMSLDRAGEALLPNAKGPITLSAASAEILAARIQADTVGGIGMAIIGDEDPAVGPYSERTGNTYIGVSGSDGTISGRLHFAGISADARTRTTNFALDLLRRYLLNLGPRS